MVKKCRIQYKKSHNFNPKVNQEKPNLKLNKIENRKRRKNLTLKEEIN